MIDLTSADIVRWLELHAPTFMQSYPAVIGTGLFFLLLALGLLLYAWRQRCLLKEETSFDHDLWLQVTNHVRNRRLAEGEALAALESGVFPSLYRAGLSAAAAGGNAAEAMAFLREEARGRFCRELGSFTLLTFACPFLGLLASAASLWTVYDDAALIAQMGPLRLLPPALCAAAGVLVTLLAGAIYTYFTIRLRRISVRLNECSLTLLELLGKNPPPAPRPETLPAKLPSTEELLRAVSRTMTEAARGGGEARQLVGARAGGAPPAPEPAAWPPTTIPSKEDLAAARIPPRREPENAPPAPRPEAPAVASDKPKPAAKSGEESVWDNLPHHF